MKRKVNKAVIAAAGYGTRFLPTTKVIQKEMLPIVDAPCIHYSVKEAIDSGVEEIIIVTRKGKTQIKDYFTPNRELEKHLQDQGKTKYLKPFEELYKKVNIIIIDQDENMPYGNGVPLLSAKKYLKEGEPFFYLYSDDIICAPIPCCRQLLDLYQSNDHAAGVIGVQHVSKEQAALYATIGLRKNSNPPIVEEMIEKPDPDKIKSQLVSFGRYLLPYKIFEFLNPLVTGKDGELWAADAVRDLAMKEEVIACTLNGQWHTTGDPLHIFKANLNVLLEKEEYKDKVIAYLQKSILKKHK